PSSFVSSAAATSKRSSAAPCFPSTARTSGALESDRTVPRTRYPASRTRKIVCCAMNPEAPVTSTVSVIVAAYSKDVEGACVVEHAGVAGAVVAVGAREGIEDARGAHGDFADDLRVGGLAVGVEDAHVDVGL